MDWGRKCLPVPLDVSDLEDEMCVCVTDAGCADTEWVPTFPISQ